MDENKKLLITGVSGLLGNNIAYYLRDQYDILGLYYMHPIQLKGISTQACDLSNTEKLSRIVDKFDPDIIIHCASLTDIDACEKDQTITWEVNVKCTKHIVEQIGRSTTKLIYISTDAVYDGEKGDFSEQDETRPKNYYGRTKLQGEIEVLKLKNSLVFRTNIFGWNVQNKESLGEWILHALKDGKQIKGFTDAFFASIYTFELGRIIDMSLQKDLKGIYNGSSGDSCSKYDFALKIADRFGLDPKLIEPISIKDFGFRAERSWNLSLNVEKLSHALNYRLPTVNYSIDAFYRDYCSGLHERLKSEQISYPKRNGFISYGGQWIDDDDIASVVNVLRSPWITQGPKVEAFEKALAEFCSTKYAVAVNSGTSALHIACLAAGIGDGREVITSPNTFVASANCVAYCGGVPVFADIDSETYNIDPIQIQGRINKNTAGVIPVHFAGQSCEMETISEIVSKAEDRQSSKIWIIEDASHALGSVYKGTKVGSCAYSDMAVMSFHPVKHITTGEGGAVLTNDETLYRKLKRIRSHGITSTTEEFIYRDQAGSLRVPRNSETVNPWYYEQIELGWNYRITDIQCALGLSQLKKMKQFIRRRKEIVRKYRQAFQGIDSVTIPYERPDGNSNFHLYVLMFDFEKIDISRAQLIRELRQGGIQTQVHYIPVHTQPFYRENFKTRWGDCPNAESYYERCLSIPLYPAMTEADVEKVIREITRIAI